MIRSCRGFTLFDGFLRSSEEVSATIGSAVILCERVTFLLAP